MMAPLTAMVWLEVLPWKACDLEDLTDTEVDVVDMAVVDTTCTELLCEDVVVMVLREEEGTDLVEDVEVVSVLRPEVVTVAV